MTVNVLVVGAGAIGAFYASRLGQVADASISVICRSSYKAVKANGFRIQSPTFGSYKWTPATTYSGTDEAKKAAISKPWDYILVCTKALPDVFDGSATVDGLVSKGSAIVLLQNGVGIEEPYVKRFPQATVLSAVVIASCDQAEPGHIEHKGWTQISIGPFMPGEGKGGASQISEDEAMGKSRQLVQLLNRGGIEDAIALDHSSLQVVRWHKIAVNAAMNPSSVLSGGSPNQDLTNDPDAYTHLHGVMNEVLNVAPKILGRPIPDNLPKPEQTLRRLQKTPGTRPSMLLDWQAGRPMEIEAILGNPLRIAQEHGFEMPRVQSLYALLKKAQQNRDAQKQSKM